VEEGGGGGSEAGGGSTIDSLIPKFKEQGRPLFRT